ncbi:MAG TPA: molecular chaperone TorD family protein [Casimicrobiaceae bacterium]|nr:molecular chaperone TorD family protein [Casimicrobiaceae bacterium]
MQVAPIAFRHRIDPEDQARADVYAVLARLYADAPDESFLKTLAAAERMPNGADDNRFAAAWNRLLDASAAMDPEAAAQEYTDLFIGVGKCEVNLHGSHWVAGFMIEKPLVELRSDLVTLKIARKEAATLLEDHFSALFETMRLLIMGDEDRPPAAIEDQRNFCQKRLLSWAFDCCTAVEKSSLANYYRRVAELTEQFLALERDSLAMD